MNYEKVYRELIGKALIRGKVDGYKENHHILPKSMGGSNDKLNLVELTAREHFIAHRLLARINPESGMVHAVYKMACIDKDRGFYKVTSRVYEVLRKEHAFKVSNDKEAALKKSLATKGRKQSEEHIKARTESRKKNGNWHSQETIDKIKIANTDNPNIGNYWRGKRVPKEAHARGVETRKRNGSYKLESCVCPHCGKEGKGNTMKVWHFDKCRNKPD